MEATSTPANIDRETRRRCHARGGVPLHLLVDRDASSLTLFSEPEGGDHRQLCTFPFGKTVSLPEPFAFDLETDAFV